MRILTRRAGVHEKGTLTLADVVQAAKANKNFREAGAVALFVGVVRGETEKKRRVEKLKLDAYEEKANEVLENICSDLSRRVGIVDVQIHHLLGEFEVGEELVYVLVAGTHRSEVFPVLREAVERYKKEVPIFKKEYVTTAEGETMSYWVNERELHGSGE
ncbi:MAG: molybdenum cofactor biosynthesis protein MoaE [Candidatus Bathyarchaeia archaeon]